MKKIIKLGIVVYSLAFASAQAADFKCPVVEAVKSSDGIDFHCSDCVLAKAHIDYYPGREGDRFVLRCYYNTLDAPWSGIISDNEPGVNCSFGGGNYDCTRSSGNDCVAICTQGTKKNKSSMNK